LTYAFLADPELTAIAPAGLSAKQAGLDAPGQVQAAGGWRVVDVFTQQQNPDLPH